MKDAEEIEDIIEYLREQIQDLQSEVTRLRYQEGRIIDYLHSTSNGDSDRESQLWKLDDNRHQEMSNWND
jgi:prefoldin subunit 5